jgi:hypothetical protein
VVHGIVQVLLEAVACMAFLEGQEASRHSALSSHACSAMMSLAGSVLTCACSSCKWQQVADGCSAQHVHSGATGCEMCSMHATTDSIQSIAQ